MNDVSGWIVDGNSLVREFVFKDFNEAWDFMTKVATLSETMQHHPDWSNNYNKVRICLSTHSKQEVTGLDKELAEKINAIS